MSPDPRRPSAGVFSSFLRNVCVTSAAYSLSQFALTSARGAL
jgi:hypothetical protein